mmetsp:Transcript_20264/g.43423  ORF Transcript_20264/g.43423 Transcript_20264/m.43423 type:complete len:89 (-) Transcript_20264:192-458(-)
MCHAHPNLWRNGDSNFAHTYHDTILSFHFSSLFPHFVVSFFSFLSKPTSTVGDFGRFLSHYLLDGTGIAGNFAFAASISSLVFSLDLT